MSFEGRYQILCRGGHYFEVDAHTVIDWVHWRCEHCDATVAWSNTIDDTNCDEHGKVVLKVKRGVVFCTCVCGHRHAKAPQTFYRPKKKTQLRELFFNRRILSRFASDPP